MYQTMKTFTDFYLDRIAEALIDRAMEKGKWMTQAEVERMHQVTYRGGMFMVRHRDPKKIGGPWRWLVSWEGQIGSQKVYIREVAGRAVTAFERVRRDIDKRHDFADFCKSKA